MNQGCNHAQHGNSRGGADSIRAWVALCVLLTASFCHAQRPGGGDAAADKDKPKDAPRNWKWSADRPVDIRHIALDLSVDLAAKHVRSTATIDLTALRDLSVIRLDAVDLDVTQVTLTRDGAETVTAEFVNDGETLEIRTGGEPLNERQKATLRITYTVSNPTAGLHFFAPSDAEPDVALSVWSQGETTENRHWFPCVDHPGEMQTTEITVTVPAGLEPVSNGKLVSKTTNPDKTVTAHWLQDKPHAAYLVTLAVQELYSETDTWRGRPVTYYVPPKHKADLRRSFGKTTAMLDFFSEYTGVEYPWDKYAQVCVEQFGDGMENTSATTMTPRTLHDERAHLDFSSDGLVAHELAHQWFGDLVTCREWAHTWLNEGFATYFDSLFTEHDLGKDEFEYDMLRNMRAGIEGGKKKPIVDRQYEDEGEMFDSRAYPKGASVLHMLRRQLGDDMFRRCIKRYLTTNAHQPVETSDLRQAFEDESGESLERFFYDWTERPGAPVVEFAFEWKEEDRLAELVVKQTQDAEPFEFPLEIQFFVGDTPLLHTIDVKNKEHRVYLPLPSRPAMVIVDPHLQVLMELKERKGKDLWSKQLKEGPGAVDRIRAAKNYAESKSDRDVKLLREALMAEPFWGVGAEIAEALGKSGGEKARDALLECLSLEHPKVRRECAAQLGTYRQDPKVAAALKAIIEKGDPSYRVEAAAISSYGSIEPPDAVPFLTSLLTRDSHQEQIRAAVLTGLGKQLDPKALDVLVMWVPRGKPRECRQAAYRAIGNYAQRNVLSDAEGKRVVDAVVDSMKGEKRRVQTAAINALRDLGRAAQPAIPALEALAANDPESRVRKTATDAVTKIRAATPGQVELTDLRAEIKKLRDETKDYQERLQKLEGKSGSKEKEEKAD